MRQVGASPATAGFISLVQRLERLLLHHTFVLSNMHIMRKLTLGGIVTEASRKECHNMLVQRAFSLLPIFRCFARTN